MQICWLDYIRLDLEHSLFSEAEVRECLRTAYAWSSNLGAGDKPVPRYALLDMGATGIIVPT
jgi:2-keto-3-deoxy-L-rhamnonate aldolase RhmA